MPNQINFENPIIMTNPTGHFYKLCEEYLNTKLTASN